jgi:hypothetical protein
MSDYLAHIATVQRGPVSYRFDALPEDSDPDFCMFSDDQIIDEIKQGKLLWFTVRCRASIEGVVLSTVYLGGNCYEEFEDFMDCSSAEDMLQEARATVLEKIDLLSKVAF